MNGQASLPERVRSLLEIIDNSLADEEYDNAELGLEEGERYTQGMRRELETLKPLLLAAPELYQLLAEVQRSEWLAFESCEADDDPSQMLSARITAALAGVQA